MLLTLDFCDEDMAALHEFARQTRRSVDDVVRAALREYCEVHDRRRQTIDSALDVIVEKDRALLDRLAKE